MRCDTKLLREVEALGDRAHRAADLDTLCRVKSRSGVVRILSRHKDKYVTGDEGKAGQNRLAVLRF